MTSRSVTQHGCHDIFRSIERKEFSQVHEFLNGKNRHKIKNVHDSEGFTVLMRAVESNNLGVVLKLIQLGSSPTIRHKESGRNVLLHACACGVTPKILSALLKWDEKRGRKLRSHSLKLTDCDKMKWGPLILACQSGNADTVQFIADNLNVFDKGNWWLRSIWQAIDAKKEEIAVKLLSTPGINSQFSESSNINVLLIATAISRGMSALCNKMHEFDPRNVENIAFKCCELRRRTCFRFCGRTQYKDFNFEYSGQCSDFVSKAVLLFFAPFCIHMRAGLFPLLCMSHRAHKSKNVKSIKFRKVKKSAIREEHLILAKIPVECMAIIGRYLFDVKKYRDQRQDLPKSYYLTRKMVED